MYETSSARSAVSSWLDPVELIPVGTLHEDRDRLGDRAAPVEHVIHVLRDRRLDAELLRERVPGTGGVEPLGHRALAGEVDERIRAPRDLLPQRPVARLVPRAGEDEIAHPRHAEEGEGVRAQGHPDARDLGEATRDEGGPRVATQLDA